MKKLLFATILILGIATLSTTAVAQQYDPAKIGIGFLYGDEPESSGLKVDATFRVSPQVAIAPTINIYFPDEDETGFEEFWAVNLNGHYIFDADQEYHVYALGGLNITTYDRDNDEDSEVEADTESELGLNLGLGGEYHLDNFSLFGEVKYVVSDLDQVVLGVGARFPLN